MQVKNRTFVISGGSTGLGLATVAHLVEKGAYVSILSFETIVTALRATFKWTQTTSAPFSGVVACAGIGTGSLALPVQPVHATHDNVNYYDMAELDRTVAVNLRGTADLIRLSLPHLALNEPWGDDGERGVIITVTSVAAFEGQTGQLAYAASKGAVRSMVLPLPRELGQRWGIRVVGIAPGVFETPMTRLVQQSESSQTRSSVEGVKEEFKVGDLRVSTDSAMVNYPARMGKGKEFARLVQEIIENPMLNGTVIRLDGGVRMPPRL